MLETVQKMVHQHGISLKKETILHSDQGCHYTCIKFIQLVKNSSRGSQCRGREIAGTTRRRRAFLDI
ncbi:MAG: hypothetical protein V8S92_06080 [Oscillospiraceae bacterium]